MNPSGLRVFMLSLGGILGVNARYWLGLWITRFTSPLFPWATLAINVSGCFAIGFLTTALARWLPHPNARLLVLVGFLGGYTTFSSFAFESVALWEHGEITRSLAYMAASVFSGFAAVVSGIALARACNIPNLNPQKIPTSSAASPQTLADQPDGGPSR